MIKRNFIVISKEYIQILSYSNIARTHLEYENVEWAPYKQTSIELTEKEIEQKNNQSD
jgi:hypothetical protein